MSGLRNSEYTQSVWRFNVHLSSNRPRETRWLGPGIKALTTARRQRRTKSSDDGPPADIARSSEKQRITNAQHCRTVAAIFFRDIFFEGILHTCRIKHSLFEKSFHK